MSADILILLAIWLCLVAAFLSREHAHRAFAGAAACLLMWGWLASISIGHNVTKASKTMSVIERAMKHIQGM